MAVYHIPTHGITCNCFYVHLQTDLIVDFVYTVSYIVRLRLFFGFRTDRKCLFYVKVYQKVTKAIMSSLSIKIKIDHSYTGNCTYDQKYVYT